MLIALFFPAISLYYGIKNGNESQKKIVLFIFFLFYGATIKFSVENDGFRHRENVDTYYQNMDLSEFAGASMKILKFQDSGVGSDDIYRHTISFISGSILGNSLFFFVIVAGVYGFFFLNVLFEIFDRPLTFTYFPLIATGFLLIMHKNIEGVNTVRTWTAMWMLLYGTLKFLKNKKPQYLLFILLTPVVHFGYFILALPVILGIVLKNTPRLAITAFIISMFFSNFNPTNGLAERFENQEIIHKRVENYSVDKKISANAKWERIESRGNQRFYNKLQSFGLHRYAFSFIIISVYFFAIRQSNTNKSLIISLFVIGVFIHAFSNFSWFIDQVSGRSRVIGEVFILMSLFLLLRDTTIYFKNIYFRWSLNFYLALMIPFAIWNISRWFDHPSFFSFILPGIVITNPDLNFSLKELLKFIIPI
ncbi:EpsG family protein [Phaeodactylibacter sp.]|uniref:EpsG family protein n=1 Tax=Phaeodactylibacter sp. TaxID=1940289 RepID=UPI0025F46BAE|nr:EpsG family protein [Phaeodactylibacter sp.]MCI5090792.1 EpsG family protein [Phaeodactylibacter sp.]